MSSKTKIIVLRMKEIIYTALFIGFAFLLILLLFFMFRNVQSSLFRKLYSNCTPPVLQLFFLHFPAENSLFFTFITFLFLSSVIE